MGQIGRGGRSIVMAIRCPLSKMVGDRGGGGLGVLVWVWFWRAIYHKTIYDII